MNPSGDYTDLAPWQWQDRDGTTLRGRRRPADGDAPTLHWLSGNGFCAGVYWPFLSRLNAAYGLITHDMAGHGESDPVRDFPGVARTIARVEATLDMHAPGPKLVAMGHSFGAALSLRMAVRHPEAFRALVLLDPIMLPRRLWLVSRASSALRRNPIAQASRRRRALWADIAEVQAKLTGRGIYKGWSDEAMAAFAQHATRDTGSGRALCCDPELEAQIFENPLYLWPDIRRLQVPTLLLYGADSYDFMRPSAMRAARRTSAITAREVTGGHCFMLQADAGDVARQVQDWLGETL